jgi:alpha-tubulin suppressor-like RCC1 family protein
MTCTGDGTMNDAMSPVQVMGITTATGVSAGGSTGDFTCAVVQGGGVMCWGYGMDGELGNGAGAGSLTPVSVLTAIATDGGADAGVGPAIADASSVSAGDSFACALRTGGGVWCWGFNTNGQLGNGNMNASLAAVPVSNLSMATMQATGWGVACALQGGQSYCWGANSMNGQIGDGTMNDSDVPVMTMNMSNAAVISVGWSHTCAVRMDNHVACWGDDLSGQLGDGTNNMSLVPVTVVGL